MIKELAFADSPLGEINLRCRYDTYLQTDVFEVKLGEEFLMSSAFTAGEIALAELALKQTARDNLNVVVGGLGLGYTAEAALKDSRVSSVTVIEALSPVIDWYERHLVPLSAALNADPRCRFVHADFFALATKENGFRQHLDHDIDIILLDIDHSPSHRLVASEQNFYTADCLAMLAQQLCDNGVFAMWSNDAPATPFLDELHQVFSSAITEEISFPNPYTGGESRNTIYIAQK